MAAELHCNKFCAENVETFEQCITDYEFLKKHVWVSESQSQRVSVTLERCGTNHYEVTFPNTYNEVKLTFDNGNGMKVEKLTRMTIFVTDDGITAYLNDKIFRFILKTKDKKK